MDAATASLSFSTKNTKTGSTATMLLSSSYFRKKNAAHAVKLQNPSSTALHQSGKRFVRVHRRSYARLKTNGGLTKPMKSNSTQIQTRTEVL